jgi:hypothetical protein
MVEPPTSDRRGSQDIVPDVNEIPHEGHENFHTGVRIMGDFLWPTANHIQRGGGGNVHKEKYGGHTSDPNTPSLLDKAKALFFSKKKEEEKKKETTTT